MNNVVTLRVRLLGGFRVERRGVPISDLDWQRRTARQLTKLLATRPSHALHKEQVLDTFWPNLDVEVARSSLAKALHAARRALEPERLPRRDSPYLHVRDDMITLDTDHVVIDADEFERHAKRALRMATASAYETALATYKGELLPEDIYEDWPSQRRHFLAELNVRLLVGLAQALENRGAHIEAVNHLCSALEQDPTREDVHRGLMRLYERMGARGLALRQYEICRAVLRREFNRAPDWETAALYDHLLGERAQPTVTSA
ncbi:MAG TPA: BTAD domain-containing putative transcriptional regulator [Acidimicrobiales bacterium]|jgi:DNA-binding SARP family transcriptional activator|nr:BTAD domain-containing putative transcriptional regulator [Acidimicrobiales bacterium]